MGLQGARNQECMKVQYVHAQIITNLSCSYTKMHTFVEFCKNPGRKKDFLPKKIELRERGQGMQYK